MSEIPPIMVLSEETPERVTFRFKGNGWAMATLIPGIVLAAAAILSISGNSQNWLLLIVGVFGLILIYSSVYSATADQWLTADGSRRTIQFHKKNLYGLVDWEKSSPDFLGIKVGRSLRSTNWHILLVCKDGTELNIGENVFGAVTLEKALNLANKVTSKTGILIQTTHQPD